MVRVLLRLLMLLAASSWCRYAALSALRRGDRLLMVHIADAVVQVLGAGGGAIVAAEARSFLRVSSLQLGRHRFDRLRCAELVVQRVIHRVRNRLQTYLLPEHSNLVFEPRVISDQSLVLSKCQFLTLLVLFLPLGDLHSQSVDLVLQLRLKCQVLRDLLLEPLFQIFDLLLLQSQL